MRSLKEEPERGYFFPFYADFMDSPEPAEPPIPFPEFESLSPMVQARLGEMAKRFGVPVRKALMLSILLAQGVHLRDLLLSCRQTGVRLTMTNLHDMRQEMVRWVADDAHRKSLLQRLEHKGLLTEARHEALRAAPSRQAMMAVYFDAVPFEVVQAGEAGGFSGDIEISPVLESLIWLEALRIR